MRGPADDPVSFFFSKLLCLFVLLYFISCLFVVLSLYSNISFFKVFWFSIFIFVVILIAGSEFGVGGAPGVPDPNLPMMSDFFLFFCFLYEGVLNMPY